MAHLSQSLICHETSSLTNPHLKNRHSLLRHLSSQMLADGANSPRFVRKNPVEQAQFDFEQAKSIRVEPAQPEYLN